MYFSNYLSIFYLILNSYAYHLDIFHMKHCCYKTVLLNTYHGLLYLCERCMALVVGATRACLFMSNKHNVKKSKALCKN